MHGGFCMKKKQLALLLALTLCVSLTPVFAASGNDSTGAPECDHFELKTYRETSLGGQLTATDPEGEPVTFKLTTEPMKGSVTVEPGGAFVYTPDEGKKGKDYFGYKATDASGNESDEATVIISIEKQKRAPSYADMRGRAEGYAAAKLAELGVFTGASVAGTALFEPDAAMTRGSFLAMCLSASGESVLRGVRTTGFSDDSAIPAWSKAYVSTGVMNGSVQGYSNGSAMVFDSERAITRAEAAVMLDRILSPAGEVEVSAMTLSDSVPAWAAQSVARLTQASVYPAGADPEAPLTRAEAAQMIVNAIDAA